MGSHSARPAPGQVLALAGLAARIILENGAETYRVEDTVVRLCKSYGYEDADVIALSTGVMVSIAGEGGSEAMMRRVRKRSINLDRVNAVNDLSRRIAAGGIPIGEAARALKAIEHSPCPARWQEAALAGCAAASFALMFGGGLLPMIIALLCGVITQFAVGTFRGHDASLVLVSLVGGIACSGLTMLADRLLTLTPQDIETALAGAIMPLISGLMMTNAVRDTLRGDILSGMARGLEALLVAAMVALGISLLLRFYAPIQGDVVIRALPWYLGVVYAGVATLFFCPLLSVPRRAVPAASLLGAVAYGAYRLFGDAGGAGEVLSLFLAAALVAVLCDALARRMRMIATVFLCAALIPLVPGLGLYRTMRALLVGEHAQALGIGIQTISAVGAIALGAAIGSLRLQRAEGKG